MILIIDDDCINREILSNIFSSIHTTIEAENGRIGLEKAIEYNEKLSAIFLDVIMPELDGMDVLRNFEKLGITKKIPVFLITAHSDDMELLKTAYSLGVMDVISKPVVPFVILKRVESVIELYDARKSLSRTVKGQQDEIFEKANRIAELNRGMIEALSTAIEFRDVESGEHVRKIYDITNYLLKHTAMGEGLTDEEIESISLASVMHDVGKISIPDSILNKPGRLTAEEFEVMKTHSAKGAQLLNNIPQLHDNAAYEYACDIARHHHERWDGRGYPDGLKGDEITVWSQVVSLADVYDALTSKRVYKDAYNPDDALEMICKGECGIFNPKLLNCFIAVEPQIRKLYTEKGEQQNEL